MHHLMSLFPPTAESHLKLLYYAVVLRLVSYLQELIGEAEVHEQFPFLSGYVAQLQQAGLPVTQPLQWWQECCQSWAQQVAGHLPLRALAEAAALTPEQLELLIAVGLNEEDPRFSHVFEALSGQRRPTIGLLSACWSQTHDAGVVRTWLQQLYSLGIVQVSNPEAPRSEWLLQPAGALWDGLRARPSLLPTAMKLVPCEQLPDETQVVYQQAVLEQLNHLPALFASHQLDSVIVRGPEHNGRQTLLLLLARQLGRHALVVDQEQLREADWRLLGPLATLCHALPIIRCNTAPGETITLPVLSAYCGPLAVVAGRQGGLAGAVVARSLTITLDLPDATQRSTLWRQVLERSAPEVQPLVEQFRLASGHLWRTAQLAQVFAACHGHTTITIPLVRQASQSLSRQAFETLATHLPGEGDWSQFAASSEILQELALLEQRCRHRERLREVAVGGAISPSLGVKALFSGPSGTGKTMAARLLAHALQRDCYRIDLAAVVNKYIGETEKNLNTVFARAEALDIVLLLDEGDALLTKRTSVNSANDRYANLETNYLLQRLEQFSGILIITTNASQRIDDAFQRRMDVVIEFRSPEPEERWQIWQTHLPQPHAIPFDQLEEIAYRCALSGGQIRNAALYATLLAFDGQTLVSCDCLQSAIEREYRKIGAVCPLPTKQLPLRT